MFLIYLKYKSEVENYRNNDYGYYAGKTYQKDFKIFPVCVEKYEDITSKGKFYKSRKIAENAAKNLLKKCSFVSSYQIIEFPNNTKT